MLDGAAIVCAMYPLNILHPGLLLGKAHEWVDSKSLSNSSSQIFDDKNGDGEAGYLLNQLSFEPAFVLVDNFILR